MRTVELHGCFGDMAGTSQFSFEPNRPVDLLNCLNSQVQGFEKHVNANGFAIILANHDMSEMEALKAEDFLMTMGKYTHIHVIPALHGEWEAFIAAVVSYFSTVTVQAFLMAVIQNLAMAVISTIISKALAPSPPGMGSEADKRPSFVINGTPLTFDQGHRIPIIMGAFTVGGIAFHTEVEIEQTGTSNGDVIPPPARPVTGSVMFVESDRGTDLPPESYQYIP